MKAWKHQIAEHFEDGTLTTDAFPALGSTVFTNYEKMVSYLRKDGRRWYIAELEVNEEEIEPFKNGFMATIKVIKQPITKFELLNKGE